MPNSNLCRSSLSSVRQIDNAAYAVGLSERVRTRVEEFGRVQPRDTEAAALVRSKVVHVVLLVAAVPTIVWSGTVGVAGLLVPFLVFWLGGLVEAVTTPGAGVSEKMQGVGKATAAVVLGFICFVNMVGVAWKS
jgi:hypothetical protein